jgi:GNAT superfamily N-acetyltransferase
MLRPAHPEDSNAIATVLIESRRAFLPFAPFAHPEADVRRWVRETLVASGRVVVWEEAGGVVAVLATSVGPEGGWVEQLYVLPGWNGRGIGAALLAHAHAVLPLPIRLHTFQQNSGARRFYERSGYRLVALSDGQGNEEKCPDALYLYPGVAPLPQSRQAE